MQSCVIFFSLVLARAGMFVTVLPLFGGINVPRMVKAGLALATLYFGNACTGPPSALLNRAVETSALAYGVAVLREAALGALRRCRCSWRRSC